MASNQRVALPDLIALLFEGVRADSRQTSLVHTVPARDVSVGRYSTVEPRVAYTAERAVRLSSLVNSSSQPSISTSNLSVRPLHHSHSRTPDVAAAFWQDDSQTQLAVSRSRALPALVHIPRVTTDVPRHPRHPRGVGGLVPPNSRTSLAKKMHIAFCTESLEVCNWHAPPPSSQPSCLRFTATSLDDIGWSPPDWSSALFSAWLVKFRTDNDLDVCVGSCQPLGLALGVGTFLVIGSDPIHTNFWGLCLSSICISFGIACFLSVAHPLAVPLPASCDPSCFFRRSGLAAAAEAASLADACTTSYLLFTPENGCGRTTSLPIPTVTPSMKFFKSRSHVQATLSGGEVHGLMIHHFTLLYPWTFENPSESLHDDMTLCSLQSRYDSTGVAAVCTHILNERGQLDDNSTYHYHMTQPLPPAIP
ncbi:hypothetical protein NA56DRAFT_701719 [Hyaloscypha hepaticicola]|uniref:Uncharacterized protein n=1 Tax=Hyaloscypha hepaticicola TaxID=2082293 RepID=A0A2J6QAX3_9HELO|nr:hypothetical protein NA56DRAFT_701719 [Hyaloscypha hepaticicola]